MSLDSSSFPPLPPPKPSADPSPAASGDGSDIFGDAAEIKSHDIVPPRTATRRLVVKDLRGAYGPVMFDDDCTSTTPVSADLEQELRGRFADVQALE